MHLQSSWHTYDHYGYAFMAVAGTVFAVLVIHWLMRSPRWAAQMNALHGVAPPFINIIGVLFGLTMAFLANDTWSAHDRAMNAVYREADSLQSLTALSDTLPEPLRARLRAALADYATASVGEWPLLARRASSPEVMARADTLLILLAGRDLGQATGSAVQSLMLQKATDLRNERDQRVALSQTHVNPLKWLGMAFLGWLTLLSIAVVHVDKPRAALVSIILFALAAAPTAAIVLIQGNPFEEPTAVTPAPIQAAIDGLRSRPQ